MRLRHFLLATCVLAGPARAHALNAVLDSIDDLPEAIQAEYTERDGKFHLQVAGGMKTEADLTAIRTNLDKERREHTALKQRVKDNFGDDKFEDIRANLDRIPELEAAGEGKLDDEAINKIVEGRLKGKLAPVERERDTLKSQLGEKDNKINELTTNEKKRTIRDAVREAATKAKVSPEALDDALMLGDAILEVREDDGKVVVKDNVGFTPGIEPSVLFTDLQTKKPHWFGPSGGGGAGGNRLPGGAGANNPFTADNWNMTQQGQLINNDPAKADQMARSAGHADALTARKPVSTK